MILPYLSPRSSPSSLAVPVTAEEDDLGWSSMRSTVHKKLYTIDYVTILYNIYLYIEISIIVIMTIMNKHSNNNFAWCCTGRFAGELPGNFMIVDC